MSSYSLRPGRKVLEIINRRGRVRPKRIVVWVSVILLLGLTAVLGFFIGASLQQQSSPLQEKSGKLQTAPVENAKRQLDIQRIEKDPSFLPMFELFRIARADAKMYRQVLAILFKLNSAQVRRAGGVILELGPLYDEILKYEDRIESGNVDEALFVGLKALMQTAFTETIARICGEPLAACREWLKAFIEPLAPLSQRFVKPDVWI